MSEIKIYSKFGEITAEPMALVDIKKSIKTVTGANQGDSTKATSDNCCDIESDTSTAEQ